MKEKKSKAKRTVLTILITVIVLAALYAVFVLTANPLFYKTFYGASGADCTIPDLWGGFVPQGVTSLDGKTLICGYTAKEASRIYVMEEKGAKRLLLAREDGSVYDGHAGGISASGEYVYISNAAKIFVLKASDVLAAKDGDTVTFIGRFDVPVRSSFCSNDGKYLYVGEFHRDGYETDESHAVGSADGTYRAMIFAYPLDPGLPFGVNNAVSSAFAVCDEVQGAAFYGGKAYLSCSYGLHDSRLKIYDLAGEDGVFSYDGRDLPLRILDGRREKATVMMPHMSEDMDVTDGRLLIAFESGVLKYGGGLLPFAERRVMRVDPALLKDEAA